MRWWVAVSIGLGAGLLPARGGNGVDSPGLPSARVPRVTITDTRDGPAERDWARAACVTLGDPWRQAPSFEPTEVRLLNSDEALWVAFLAQDRDIVATHTVRKSRTYLDDCVELFLGRPEENLTESFGLEINPLGTLSDYRYRQPELLDLKWRAEGVRIRAEHVASFGPGHGVTGPGYRIVVAVPWSLIREATGLTATPVRLRANFGRWDQGTGVGVFTLWSDSKLSVPKPHNTARYGWLLFD